MNCETMLTVMGWVTVLFDIMVVYFGGVVSLFTHSLLFSCLPSSMFLSSLSLAIGVCQTKAQLQNLLPVVIAITLSLTLIVIVLIILVLWVKIHNLKHNKPVNSSGSANSDSSENSVTTESESLPSPTSASSPHHHYLHVTTDEPAFGDSLKCNGSKA